MHILSASTQHLDSLGPFLLLKSRLIQASEISFHIRRKRNLYLLGKTFQAFRAVKFSEAVVGYNTTFVHGLLFNSTVCWCP